MPEIVFAPAVRSSPGAWAHVMSNLGTVPITTFSATPFAPTLGAGQPPLVVSGSGFAISSAGVFTGGAIDLIEFRNFGATQATLSNPCPSAQALQQAALLDALGANNSAVEALVLPLGGTFNGANTADALLANAASSDGAVLTFAGKDTFLLAGGTNKSQCGTGRDTIDGGLGDDTLTGNSGNDKISGSTGQDTRAGDGGRDAFILALGDRSDRITDFKITVDRIDLSVPMASVVFTNIGGFLAVDCGAGDRILFEAASFFDQGLVTFIRPVPAQWPPTKVDKGLTPQATTLILRDFPKVSHVEPHPRITDFAARSPPRHRYSATKGASPTRIAWGTQGA